MSLPPPKPSLMSKLDAPTTVGGAGTVHRLKVAIAKIAERPDTPTSAKNILAEFMRVCNPKLERSTFPVTLHRHPVYPDRMAIGGNKWLILYGIIGDCIDVMQDNLRKRGALADVLAKRLARLEAFADYPMERLMCMGDDSTGHELTLKPEP